MSTQASKHDIKIAQGAVVCHESKLRGDITIGAMTVVHPKASIIAESGPIIIGEYNIVEEQACIINRLPPGPDPSSPPTLVIGSYNVFEVDCHFESPKMGDNNVLEVKSSVGQGVELTNGCTVGAGCKLDGNEVLPEYSVVFGSECKRRVAIERPQPQTSQLDSLSKVLVNYHHLKKPRSGNT